MTLFRGRREEAEEDSHDFLRDALKEVREALENLPPKDEL